MCAPKALDDNIQYILSVDRLDYTRGLANRILAIEKLFQDHPEHQEKVVFRQIVIPSGIKENQDLKDPIDKIVEMVNRKFSTQNWSPIKFIYGVVAQNDL